MQRTHLTVLIIGACTFAVAAGSGYFLSSSKNLNDDSAATQVNASKAKPDLSSEAASPFATLDPVTEQGAAGLSVDTTVAGANSNSIKSSDSTQNLDADALVRERSSNIDVTSVGRSTIGDAEFEQLVTLLRSDPALLQQFIDEFRQETGATRRLELLRLLGEAGGPAVTLTASELIYSGDPESRIVGLELLQLVQPGNAEALSIASGLLATEIEPEVLVGTLTTLANPGDVAEESREFLAEQVAFLTTHNDASVRSISLNILSRWSTGTQFTPVLLEGLNDPAERVRESAAFALVGHEDGSDDVIAALFTLATDTAEDVRARRGAILALRGMSITPEQRDELVRAERELDTVRR